MINEIVDNSDLASEAKSYFDEYSAGQMIRELKQSLNANVESKDTEIIRLRKAIELITDNFTPDVLADQMGEDYDNFKKLCSI